MAPGLIALIIGIALLVVAYTVPTMPPPVRTLCMVFGWILAIVGGLLLVLFLLGVPVSLGAR
jgi:hypothetical protein